MAARLVHQQPDSSPGVSVRPAALVVALLLAVGCYQLNNTMVAPANPDIIAKLHTTAGTVGLAQTLFTLVGAVVAVVFTRLSDWTGRRRAIMISLAVLVIGEVLCAVAPNAGVYVAGRALSGGCGAVYPFAFLILRELMPVGGFSRALAIIAAAKSGIGGLESVVGGAIADHLGFRGIFWFMLVFTAVAVVAVRTVVPEVRAVRRQRLDWPGSITLGLGLTGIVLGLSKGGVWGWTDARTLVCLLGGAVLLVAFPAVERRSDQPLMDAKRLLSRASLPLLGANVLVLAGAFAATSFVIPLLSQAKVGFGMSATESALLFVMPVSTVGFVVAPFAGWIAPRVGWRRLLIFGLVITLAGVAALALGTSSTVVTFVAIVVLGGFYTGLVLTALDGLGVLLSPGDAPGSLTGLNTAAFGVGASVGVALVSNVLTQGSRQGVATLDGYTNALWVCAGLVLLGGLVALLIPRQGEGVAPATDPSATGVRENDTAARQHPLVTE